MEYLMKEEIKSTRSADYYNVAQSDVRALVRGELTTLKTALAIAKSRAIDAETKYHYADCIERIAMILDPK
jgi:plasmid maintenance system antidote protein VapI